MPEMQKPVGAGYWLVVAAIVLAGVALRVMLYDPLSQYHADEFYQYLEQGHRIVDGWGLVAWEGRLGIRNGLIPQFLALPWVTGEMVGPGTMAPIHFARGAFMALCLLSLAGAWGIGRARSHAHALAALLVAAIWYDSVFFGVALLSESAGTALIACGTALLLVKRAKSRTLRAAGFLLVLGALVRLQYAPFVAVLVLLVALKDKRVWGHLFVGALAALAIGAASDIFNQQTPFSWVAGTVSANLGQGIAARFGTEGPLFYGKYLLTALGPAAPAILIAALFAGRRYWPVIAATLVSLVFHSLIAHKEVRFIWLSTFMILVLASIATVNLVDWLVARRKSGPVAARIGLIAVLAGWIALSFTVGGKAGEARLPRKGTIYPLVLRDVAKHPEICGLAIPEQRDNFIITAFLGRNVPLYVMPVDLLGGLSPLPDGLAAAANAAINDGELLSNPEYEQVTCHEGDGENACLLVRKGGCDPEAGKEYEAEAWMIENKY